MGGGNAASIRATILEHIRTTGNATCDEIEIRFGLRHQTASARVRELSLMKAIKDSGNRRDTRSGRSARVYVVNTEPVAIAS
jgi:predicted transcriptional regulator